MLTGILPNRSNLASWSDSIEFIDDETGELIDISEATEISVRLRARDEGQYVLQALLSASEVVIEGTGVATFSFTAEQMSNLCPKTYEVGVLITINDETEQVILGYLPIVRGL